MMVHMYVYKVVFGVFLKEHLDCWSNQPAQWTEVIVVMRYEMAIPQVSGVKSRRVYWAMCTPALISSSSLGVGIL